MFCSFQRIIKGFYLFSQVYSQVFFFFDAIVSEIVVSSFEVCCWYTENYLESYSAALLNFSFNTFDGVFWVFYM